jgi:hypothetical protein
MCTTVDDLRIIDNLIGARTYVRLATTVAGTLATSFESGQVVDGVILIADDRILIKNQVSQEENGIYIVEASGTPQRAVDFDSGKDVASVYTWVQGGTTNGCTAWICSNLPGSDMVGVDPITFIQFDTAKTLTVDRGGTGLSSIASDMVLVGSGTSTVNAVKLAPSGDFIGTTDAQTLTNKTLDSPIVSTGLLDADSNVVLGLDGFVLAVNNINIANAVASSSPAISAAGTDTDISILQSAKGNGKYIFGNSTTAAEIRLLDIDGSDYVGIQSPGAATAYTITLPPAQGGSGQTLQNNGSGVLSWVTPTSNVNSNSSVPTSTSSTSYVLLDSMSLPTPAPGTWIVSFSSSGSSDTLSATCEYGIFIDDGTTPITGTHRTLTLTMGANSITTLHSGCIVSVNGSQDIEIYYKTSSGSFDVLDRILNAVKIS